MKVELLQANGRTLEITPAEGVRTAAPVLPRGEVLVLGGVDYIVVAIRQTLVGWPGLDAWDAETTYLVDEAVDDAEACPVCVPEGSDFMDLMSEVWPQRSGGTA
ncbi:hypothetical protein [Streptomyces atratus]|uniref:hypothetical protein n=1 Tax=Streptomyces atratus TaxID=1893 RepID=UPI00364CB5CC